MRTGHIPLSSSAARESRFDAEGLNKEDAGRVEEFTGVEYSLRLIVDDAQEPRVLSPKLLVSVR